VALFSVFGASGFIGRNVAAHLAAQGHSVAAMARGDLPSAGAALGHAIYCIGLTANFRANLTATARAHVGVLADIIDAYEFESFLYLSSTRVYAGAARTGEEEPLTVQPSSAGQVYNLSKLAGEALCLGQSAPEFRVARISNVVGPGDAPVNFLPSLLEEARRTGALVVRTSPPSSKDYIDIGDVCRTMENISLSGKRRLYNVASGNDTTNATIATLIETALGVKPGFAADAPTTTFPRIDISRIREEFAFSPASFETSFEKLLAGSASGKGDR
jgi:nucleoside-diphosphate-sugar epimerase